MKLRSEIKLQAREKFNTQYGVAVGALVLYMLISAGISWITSIANIPNMVHYGTFYGMYSYSTLAMNLSQLQLLISIFLVPPVMVGYLFFSLRIYRGEDVDIGGMFREGFSGYWRKVGGVLWMELFIFLWSLLFIIPGIIKALSYSMTPFILAEHKNVPATEALKISMRMTQGYKGEIFVMGLSFIGWLILSALTAGILYIFYVGPYINTSFAGLYDELKKNALENGTITTEELA